MFAMLTFRLMYSPGDVNTQLLRAIALDMLCVKSTVTEMRGLVANNAALEARIAFLESQNRAAQEKKDQRDLKWRCPVCLEPFKHRESFKGHIMRLKDPVTARAKCFLDCENERHRELLAHPRYGGGDFESRRLCFADQFYQTVRSNSTSTRTSESSHSAV